MSRTAVIYGVSLALLSAAVGASVWFYPAPGGPPAAASRRPAPEADAHATGKAQAPPPQLPPGVRLHFADVTRTAGIDFTHVDGRVEMQYLMDSTGSGVAWIDYDQDGRLDLFLVQNYPFVPPFPEKPQACKLYRNLGGGQFEDVTARAGVGHVGCGQGARRRRRRWRRLPRPVRHLLRQAERPVPQRRRWQGRPAVRGRHGEGRPGRTPRLEGAPELEHQRRVPRLRQRRQARPVRVQLRQGRSEELPRVPGEGRPAGDVPAAPVRSDAVRPLPQPGRRHLRRRLPGGGRRCARAKALGVVALDLDDDGKIDIFVANDGVPNYLFRNLGGGKFEQVALPAGCAVNLVGTPQAYMGVDADDLDGDGLPDLFVTAFSQETNTFFRNQGRGQFLDVTRGSGLGPPSWFRLGFGAAFLDVDRDGGLDITVANGHVARFVEAEGDPNVTFKQASQLYLNDGRGRFQDVSAVAGPYFGEMHVGRGVAVGDYDNDGNADLAFSNSGGRAVLLHNETQTPNGWLRLELHSTKSNRDAVGAKVTVRAGGRALVRHRKGGGSYLAGHDPRLLIGLGSAKGADEVEVRWPSGLVQKVGPLEGGRGYRVTEGEAKVERRP